MLGEQTLEAQLARLAEPVERRPLVGDASRGALALVTGDAIERPVAGLAIAAIVACGDDRAGRRS